MTQQVFKNSSVFGQLNIKPAVEYTEIYLINTDTLLVVYQRFSKG